MEQPAEADRSVTAQPTAQPHAMWLRVGVISLVAITSFAGIVAFSYQLALARVPQHRATLERLVRARTGLDVRFNELGVRWGWYGPEAVFGHVELGEPGESAVLLRASQLVVGFDAWKTVQTGHLQAGRITFVAPDIDLTRPIAQSPSATSKPRPSIFAESRRSELLSRWPRGRVDVESATLRVPGPGGSSDAYSMQIKRASFRRSDTTWSAAAQAFLPERLGKTARLSFSLEGDANKPTELNGLMRFEGRRLAFAGWRELLRERWDVAQYVPAAGGGDMNIVFKLKAGSVASGQGSLRASEVAFRRPPWQTPGTDVMLDYLRGDWTLTREDDGMRFIVDDLAFGPQGRDAPSTTLTLNFAKQAGIKGKLGASSVETLSLIGQWFAPALDLTGASLQGKAEDIAFEWQRTADVGHRLRFDADVNDLSLSSNSKHMILSGLKARLSGDESLFSADVEGTDARLVLERMPDKPLDSLRVVSRLQFKRAENGWELSTDQLSLEHDKGKLLLTGALHLQPAAVTDVDARGTFENADIELLKAMLGEDVPKAFGPSARLTAGRIENGTFHFAGPANLFDTLDWSQARAFEGALAFRNAVLTGDDTWPDVEGLDAQFDWNGPRLNVKVAKGTAGPVELASLNAEWRTDHSKPLSVTGEGRGQLEAVFDYLNTRPSLRAYAPEVEGLRVRGPATFKVTATGPSKTKPVPRVRVVTAIENGVLHLAPQWPAVESVKGTLTFDAGRLQRSTMAATWLGGPATLRISEHKDKKAVGVAVQAQGTLDADEVAKLAKVPSAVKLTGRTAWKADLVLMPNAPERLPSWRMRFDSSLLGIESELPAPLRKVADVETPLRIDLDGAVNTAALRVAFGDDMRGTFELAPKPDTTDWSVTRGALRFGGEAADLPDGPEFDVRGRMERLDLAAWIAASRPFAEGDRQLPVNLALAVDLLTLGGRRYDDVTLGAQRNAEKRELRIESPTLAGVVRWRVGQDDETPATDAHFTVLSIPEKTEDGDLAFVQAALGPVSQVSADQLIWQGRPLGSATAKVSNDGERVSVDPLRFAAPSHDVKGTLVCSNTCQMDFELESRDAAASLAALGFRDDLTASNASVRGAIVWPSERERPWIETVTGRVSLALTDGVIRAAGPARDGKPFPLLPLPTLLRQSAVTPIEGAKPQEPSDLNFAALEASYELRDGVAETSNLHLDGDAEILMRGRAGLVDRDYDYTAWVLRGEDRLPTAVRRLGASPRVAAAWMALRDFLSTPTAAGRSRAVVHLGGTWDEPSVGPAKDDQ